MPVAVDAQMRLIKYATNYAMPEWWGSQAIAIIYVAVNPEPLNSTPILPFQHRELRIRIRSVYIAYLICARLPGWAAGGAASKATMPFIELCRSFEASAVGYSRSRSHNNELIATPVPAFTDPPSDTTRLYPRPCAETLNGGACQFSAWIWHTGIHQQLLRFRANTY